MNFEAMTDSFGIISGIRILQPPGRFRLIKSNGLKDVSSHWKTAPNSSKACHRGGVPFTDIIIPY